MGDHLIFLRSWITKPKTKNIQNSLSLYAKHAEEEGGWDNIQSHTQMNILTYRLKRPRG